VSTLRTGRRRLRARWSTEEDRLDDAIANLGPRAVAAASCRNNLTRAENHLIQARGYLGGIDHGDDDLRRDLRERLGLVRVALEVLETMLGGEERAA
jgi:hypothetical protein